MPTDHRPPPTDHRSPITDHRLPPTDHRSLHNHLVFQHVPTGIRMHDVHAGNFIRQKNGILIPIDVFSKKGHFRPTGHDFLVNSACKIGGRLRPAHLMVALEEAWDPVVSSAAAKLGHDPFEVLRGLSGRLIEGFEKDPPEGEEPQAAVEKEMGKGKKDSALRRFGGDLTEVARQGADRVNAETLKAEILKWGSRKRWGGLAAGSRALATAGQRW